MMKPQQIILIILLFVSVLSTADTNHRSTLQKCELITITGQILDDKGNPMEGTLIFIRGTTYGAGSNEKGFFSLKALYPYDQLAIMHTGYKDMIVSADKDMSIQMQRRIIAINDDNAVNYRTITQVDTTIVKPLFVIGDDASPKDRYDDPRNIERIKIFKPKKAMRKFGDAGKHGAVQIFLKENIEQETVQFGISEPVFPGGEFQLLRTVKEAVKSYNLSGVAIVCFSVGANGEVCDAETVESTSPELNKPAEDIMENIPKWRPGKQRGKPVKVDYRIKIEF